MGLNEVESMLLQMILYTGEEFRGELNDWLLAGEYFEPVDGRKRFVTSQCAYVPAAK